MGTQSARIYGKGADHKDIYFQGKYHNKMYIGNELVWEKIGDNIETIQSASASNLQEAAESTPTKTIFTQK